jgi:DNA-binding FadR family transcriptional regulator
MDQYHNTLSTRPISERIAFRLTEEDKQAVLALRDLLRPTMPLATRTDIIRAALREAVEALTAKRGCPANH